MYARIVEDALVATEARLVILTMMDSKTRLVRTEASAGYGSAAAKRALRAARRVFASFDPTKVELRPDVNPIQEAVFLRGEHVTAPFMDVAARVVPDVIIRIAARFLGLRESSVHPLIVRDEVIGSLSFHGSTVPSERHLHAYRAFASQVSLTLENAVLLGSLHEQVEQLRKTRRLVRASNEAVRREIAETLHGPVQTQLLVADLLLRQAAKLTDASPGQAKRAIEEARGRIDDVRQEDIRHLSHVLHPSVIRLGLGPALRSLADQYASLMNVRVSLDLRLDGAASTTQVELSLDTRLAIYRVLEEGLVNAHRHGRASNVDVSAELDGDGRLVMLRVTDDGSGVDSDTLQKGLGLHMIAMRVAEMDGDWSVVGEAGRGTTLTATFSLLEDAPDERGNDATRGTDRGTRMDSLAMATVGDR